MRSIILGQLWFQVFPGAVGVGMIKPVLEKAPDLDMKLDSAATPSTVPRIVDRDLGWRWLWFVDCQDHGCIICEEFDVGDIQVLCYQLSFGCSNGQGSHLCVKHLSVSP